MASNRDLMDLFTLPKGVISSYGYWREKAIDTSTAAILGKLEEVDKAISQAFGRVKGSSRRTSTWQNVCAFFPDGALEAYMRDALTEVEDIDSIPRDLIETFDTVLPAEFRGKLREFVDGDLSDDDYHKLYNVLYSEDPLTGATTMATVDEAQGIFGALPKAAKKGAEMGLAMVAQDIVQDATRKILVEGLGVDPKTLEFENELVRDLANILGPAVLNLAAVQADGSLPGAKYLAAAGEAAFTGRVAAATYKHGTTVKNLATIIGPQLNELRKVGAQLLNETLQPGDLQEIEGETTKAKRKSA